MPVTTGGPRDPRRETSDPGNSWSRTSFPRNAVLRLLSPAVQISHQPSLTMFVTLLLLITLFYGSCVLVLRSQTHTWPMFHYVKAISPQRWAAIVSDQLVLLQSSQPAADRRSSAGRTHIRNGSDAVIVCGRATYCLLLITCFSLIHFINVFTFIYGGIHS
ncbi:hypothetical protein V3C99_014320 [Haemonchus contortus]